MYNEYECVLFPGDSLLPQIEESDIVLGTQDYNQDFVFPYSIVGHMSRRKKGETDLEIRWKLEQMLPTDTIPVLCVWPIEATDTLKDILDSQLAVLDIWPAERDIIIAYEPGFAVGTGQTMTLEDIEIMYQILAKLLKPFTNKSIIYWGSVNAGNIADIIRLTDGVIVGKASQEKVSLLSLFISLGEQN